MIDANELIRLGQEAKSNGNNALALDYFQQALQQHPNELSLQSVCGNLCVYLSRFEEAAGYFRRILHATKSTEARNALCYALNALGNQADTEAKYVLAEACFEEALSHQPNNASYWYNLGNAQRELRKIVAAKASFLKGIHCHPTDANAYNNLGNVQRELGELDAAIESYRQALNIDPDLHHARAHLIHQRQHICDWQGEGTDSLKTQINMIREVVNTLPKAQITPFAFLAMPGTTPLEQKRCADQYATQQFSHLKSMKATLGFQHQKQAKEKLKIAYLSADFRLHPLAFLITELIEAHNRDFFEIYAYSYGDVDNSNVRKRLVNAFDSLHDIRQLNDVEAAEKIYDDGIDILIDLTGYTQSSRTALIALKPAAIHINWLGFPGTMGQLMNSEGEQSSLFDYIIVDDYCAPDASVLTEKCIKLPCYQPNSQRAIAANSTRKTHQLPEKSFVFCCFNQTFKITPDVFAVWMRLLNQTPDSVLWLMECNQWAKQNLQKEATRAGINPSRLIFAQRLEAPAHIERQQHADLFLDTIPYNAHTTASDALWAGLPILTCLGETFASRVCGSLLNQLGLSELICDSLEAYEKKARYLANQPNALADIKKQLNNKKTSSGLFDSVRFAQKLEAQFLQIWETYLNSPSD